VCVCVFVGLPWCKQGNLALRRAQQLLLTTSSSTITQSHLLYYFLSLSLLLCHFVFHLVYHLIHRNYHLHSSRERVCVCVCAYRQGTAGGDFPWTAFLVLFLSKLIPTTSLVLMPAPLAPSRRVGAAGETVDIGEGVGILPTLCERRRGAGACRELAVRTTAGGHSIESQSVSVSQSESEVDTHTFRERQKTHLPCGCRGIGGAARRA
jgi:hypothetical protein